MSRSIARYLLGAHPTLRRNHESLVRLLLISSLAFIVSGCAAVGTYLITGAPPRADCELGYKPDDRSCKNAAYDSRNSCRSYRYEPNQQVCTGLSCEGEFLLGEDFSAGVIHCGDVTVLTNQRPKEASEGRGTDMLPARSTMQLNVASDLLSPAVSAAMALPAGNAAAATSVAAITEFSLPQPGMQPGPIIAAGQNVLFGSVASCSGPCGVYSISATGATVPAGNGCVGQNCRHTGLAPTADGGYCYAVTNQLFDGELKDPIIACSTKAFQASHFLHAFNGTPAGLALAADGSIWFTDVTLNGIGRIAVLNTAVVNATYLDPTTGLGLGAIAGGPDGSMWFAAINANKIGRVVNGELSLMGIPTADSQPAGVIVGPDGNLWFAEFKANKIGRLTPAGVFTEFSLPTVDAQPLGIATGPDGALWFTEFNGNKIGRISRFGDISEYPVPTASSQPAGIVTGPDGNLWFTELQGNKIGKLVPAPASTAPQVIEFYNTPLDTFFITANAAEAAAIDSGSAGPGWSRTGSTFSSGGSTPVCRFYGSVTPGPNSHFYTADAAECQALKDLQAATPATQPRWNFESLDFSTTPAVNGACAAGLVPVYRAYNNGAARGVGSNHRITGSPGAIAEVVQRGWISEGVVMCSPA